MYVHSNNLQQGTEANQCTADVVLYNDSCPSTDLLTTWVVVTVGCITTQVKCIGGMQMGPLKINDGWNIVLN
jgi:hypothetical protein